MASLTHGHGFGWTLGVGDRQEGLACCGSWGHKESDTTEQLNCTELKICGYIHFSGERKRVLQYIFSVWYMTVTIINVPKNNAQSNHENLL